MISFDPNAAATSDSGVFGLPFTEENSALVLIPVPWEATTSYGEGTSKGPKAILEASRQVDLFDVETGKPYEAGICMLPESQEVRSWNKTARDIAQKIIEVGGVAEGASKLAEEAYQVNGYSNKVNDFVYSETKRLLKAGKITGVVGGDHSVPYGTIKALAEKYPGFGILHFDAHSDLRVAYEGFTHSHASIMYNVMQDLKSVGKLVQVGIRDFCEQEFDYIQSSKGRIRAFFDSGLVRSKFEGQPWLKICQQIVQELPKDVYISFDIDGLDPSLCPNTGTPVPGGLSFQEATALIREVVRSGRRIVGFDLNEVAPGENDGEWNANVGARLLYKLCGWTLVSQKLCKPLN